MSNQVIINSDDITTVARLFVEVWERLSEEDKERVGTPRLFVVSAEALGYHEGAEGLASLPEQEGECPWVILGDCIESDADGKYLCAHELAHIILKHSGQAGGGDEAEAEADAQAERWGYPKPGPHTLEEFKEKYQVREGSPEEWDTYEPPEDWRTSAVEVLWQILAG